MKTWIAALFVSVIALPALANEDILFNSTAKRGVVDLYTDSALKPWEQNTALFELCYKNADAQTALNEILKLKEDGVLFTDGQTEDYQDSEIKGATVLITVYNEKMLDDGIEPEDAFETHEIGPCDF